MLPFLYSYDNCTATYAIRIKQCPEHITQDVNGHKLPNIESVGSPISSRIMANTTTPAIGNLEYQETLQ